MSIEYFSKLKLCKYCVAEGSTEWVEHNLVNLGTKAVAYLNVDCAVQGPGFFAGATPQLDNLLYEVTKKVNDRSTAFVQDLFCNVFVFNVVSPAV